MSTVELAPALLGNPCSVKQADPLSNLSRLSWYKEGVTAGNTFDSIVVGVGGMGSAALYHLARRGARVLGIDRFDVPNEMGSSHGLSRIIRLAYFEHPDYVPLLRRAYELWRDLERETREELLYITGSIDAGPPGSRVLEGSLRSCQAHSLPFELLNSTDVTRRFPGYRLPLETMAVLQPDGGFLVPERCISAYVNRAKTAGASVHTSEKVTGWESTSSGVRVRTDRAVYEAEHLILSAGAWTRVLLDSLAPVVIPERQVMGWFAPLRPDYFEPSRFPVFNLSAEEGHYYGFPMFGIPGFKIGRYHHLGERVDPDSMPRTSRPDDEAILRGVAEKYFPDGTGMAIDFKVCMFTNSPDEHFILDLVPGYPQVAVAAGFSGHGFKFCSVVGEILADLILSGSTDHSIDFLRATRFEMSAETPRRAKT